jgi:hypothetical protein
MAAGRGCSGSSSVGFRSAQSSSSTAVPAEAAAVEQQATQVAYDIGGGMRHHLDAVARRVVVISRISVSH